MKINVHSFWLYQITGWLLYYFVNIIQILSSRMIYPKKFLTEFIEALIGFILTSLIRLYYKKIDFHLNSIFHMIGRISLVSLAISTIWYFAIFINRWYILKTNVNRAVWDLGVAINWISTLAPIIFSWSALYFGLKFWLEWDQQSHKVDQANSIATEARLQMLRYQLNPHFLFNALNSVKALIGENDNNARLMISELSDFLRYPLVHKNDKFVPLQEEISAIKNYLSIEKKRFEEKLNTEFEIDPKIIDFPVLSFLIYPIVENAVKYGMKTSNMPLKILIKAEAHNGGLQISVINTGSWVEPNHINNCEGTGTGLENVKLRLKNTFQDEFRFEHFDREGKTFVILEIKRIMD